VNATGWYVYGVVDADRPVDDGDGIEVVRGGRLAAVVAQVDLAEFDDLERRLNDRAWVERKALEHETVLSRIAFEGPVVPLRFGAIYHRLDDVEQLLRERGEEFEADLERVRGRVELGVKGFVVRPALEEMLARERTATAVGASPGRAYLERRQIQQDVAAEASAILVEAGRSTHARLLERSVEGVLSRPHSRELSGRREEMFFNGAYLVPAEDDSLRAEVAAVGRAYAPLCLSFEVTGPWPPYSFVGRRDEAL
jgi:Gas vesicle synthesis protein GvpL/GvpF